MFDPLKVLIDLDDTLIKTHSEIVRLMKRDTGFEFKGKGFITNENTEGNLQVVLDKAEFMYTAKPELNLVYQLQKLKLTLGKDITIGFCTHRGYHPKGVVNTERMLKRLSTLMDLSFLELHLYSCPFTNPNKLEELEANFADNFILVDDNPKFSSKDDLGEDPRVMLYTKDWNTHIEVKDSLRVNLPTEFLSKLVKSPIFKERFNGRSEVQQLR